VTLVYYIYLLISFSAYQDSTNVQASSYDEVNNTHTSSLTHTQNFYDRDQAIIFTYKWDMYKYEDPLYFIKDGTDYYTNVIYWMRQILFYSPGHRNTCLLDFYVCGDRLTQTTDNVATTTYFGYRCFPILYISKGETTIEDFNINECEKIDSGAVIDNLKEVILETYLHFRSIFFDENDVLVTSQTPYTYTSYMTTVPITAIMNYIIEK